VTAVLEYVDLTTLSEICFRMICLKEMNIQIVSGFKFSSIIFYQETKSLKLLFFGIFFIQVHFLSKPQSIMYCLSRVLLQSGTCTHLVTSNNWRVLNNQHRTTRWVCESHWNPVCKSSDCCLIITPCQDKATSVKCIINFLRYFSAVNQSNSP